MEDASMNIPRPRLTGDIGLGQLLNSSLMVAFLSVLVYLIQWKGDVDSVMKKIDPTADAVVVISASDKLQDEKIAGFSRTLDNVVQKLDKASDKLSEIGTSVAVIEERTKKAEQN